MPSKSRNCSSLEFGADEDDGKTEKGEKEGEEDKRPFGE
jgi:hypothetical protein